MVANSKKKWGYVIAWEFRPKAGADRKFEEAYGPAGVWAKLFRQGEGFVATELSRDVKDATRYLTLDLWESNQPMSDFARSGLRTTQELMRSVRV